MTFEYFCRKVEKAVQDFLPDVHITVQKIGKNNGVSFTGLVFAREESQAAAVIRLGPVYEDYEKGTTLAEAVRRILRTYEAGRDQAGMDLGFFTDYEQVKPRLSCRLINRERNRAHLENAPHILLLDLALVPCCMLQGDDTGCACILIDARHLKLWGLEEETLMRDALENMGKSFPGIVTSMDTFILQTLRVPPGSLARQAGREEGREEENRDGSWEEGWEESLAEFLTEAQKECGMMVCTNLWHFYGAGSILTPGLLEKLAQKLQASLYILPASVHELILLPDTGRENAGELRGIVEEVNSCQVLEEEFLSDNVYYYDREEGRIQILQDGTVTG